MSAGASVVDAGSPVDRRLLRSATITHTHSIQQGTCERIVCVTCICVASTKEHERVSKLLQYVETKRVPFDGLTRGAIGKRVGLRPLFLSSSGTRDAICELGQTYCACVGRVCCCYCLADDAAVREDEVDGSMEGPRRRPRACVNNEPSLRAREALRVLRRQSVDRESERHKNVSAQVARLLVERSSLCWSNAGACAGVLLVCVLPLSLEFSIGPRRQPFTYSNRLNIVCYLHL